MLFQPSINAQANIQFNATNNAESNVKILFITLILSLGLSACSSTNKVELSEKEKLELIIQEQKEQTLDGDIAKQGTKNSTKETSDETQPKIEDDINLNNGTLLKVIPAKNLYLEQQESNPLIIPEKTQNDYKQAINLMEEKKWSKAEVLLDQIILTQPKLSGSYVNKAIIAKQQNKLEQAQLLLNQAIKINKLNLYAHHEQGQIYRLQGQFIKAEDSYLAALAIWPNFAEAHVSMAILLELYRGRLLEAYTYYRSYLVLVPDDEEAKRWQAGLAIKIKRAGLELPPVKSMEADITNQVIDHQVIDDNASPSSTSSSDVQEPEND